jgi:plastocyanin
MVLSKNLPLLNSLTTIIIVISVSILVSLSVLSSPMQFNSVISYAQQPLQSASPIAGGTTFPPPIFYKLRNIPSYAITIPFSSSNFSNFDPVDVSIPLGMTVIWFNDANSLHSVTTIANKSYSPPQKVDSGPIPPNGGSFIHTFSKPGTYEYHDKFNPHTHGTISVGTGIQPSKNMNMMIGGNTSSFNPNEARRTMLSFIPKTVSIPPTISLTYQVTILNTLRPWLIFSHKYDDADGILDLELIPTHNNKSKTNFTDFTTWGPDFRSQEAFRTTGTFHVRGPVLVDDSEYDIRVAIVSKDNKILSKPISDSFVLLRTKPVT